MKMQLVKFVGFYFNSVTKGKDVKSMTSAHLRKQEKKKREQNEMYTYGE